MTNPYAMFLWSANQYQEADLILPEGGKIHYVRTSPGTDFEDAVFEHTTTPTSFYKSKIVWNGDGWDLIRKDGMVLVFGDMAPLQAIRDRYGNTVTIDHGAGQQFGNVLQVTSPNGRWIKFTYDASNRVIEAKDNIGRTVAYSYLNGNLSTVTDPENNVTTYTYDASNRLATIKDGRNIVFVINTYDSNGRVVLQKLADQTATYQFTYVTDGSGNVTQTDITDPRGHVERLAFNADHQIVSGTQAFGTPLARTETIERQPGTGLVTAIVDGLGRRTEYTRNSAGKVLTVTRLAGTGNAVTSTFTYDPQYSQVATVTDPLNHTWSVGYDAQGRLASLTDPLTHQTTFATNAAGQVTGTTDPLQHTWQVEYVGGDIRSLIDPMGGTSTRFADAAGRVLVETDPLGAMTRTVVDKLDRVTSVTDAGGGQTTFAYDPNGRVLSLTDALTRGTAYTYDTSDRVATRTDALQRTITFQYDKRNNVTNKVDRKGQLTSYEYDALDRLTLVTYDDDSTVQYVYDAGDRVTQIIDSTAGTITRTYDGLDRLTSETTPEGTVSYTYDADGRRETMTVTGQSAVSYVYDDAHRLTSITQGMSTVEFAYDAADRPTTVTLPNGVVTTRGYDNANRLTSLSYTLGPTTLGDLTYMYDAGGNVTSMGGTWARTGLPPAVASAVYDGGNQLSSWGSQSYSYDANGNIASDGVTSYTWNARDELIALSGGTAATFQYDGVGRRRTKTVGGMTNFLYDGSTVVQELVGGSVSANLLAGKIDEIFQRTDASGTTNFLVDGLGSTVALTDAGGAAQTHYIYDPFGATTSVGVSSANSSQFTGRENDGTGLYYFRTRYTNPAAQRFISEDTLGFAGGDVNLHAYVFNAPTRYVDPTGEIPLRTPPGTFPTCERIRGSKNPSWWQRLQCRLELDSIIPTPLAIEAQGAKSAAELAKHINKLNKFKELLNELKALKDNAKMRNTVERLAKEIAKVEKEIRGHIKEMLQKWPDWTP
jgi:RHS repeat-associated protein